MEREAHTDFLSLLLGTTKDSSFHSHSIKYQHVCKAAAGEVPRPACKELVTPRREIRMYIQTFTEHTLMSPRAFAGDFGF